MNNAQINRLVKEENKYNLNKKKTFLNFYKKINNIKKTLNELISNLLKKVIKFMVMVRQLKGNVLLQYFELTSKQIPFIADRNPDKNNLFTQNTKIKIINENKSRSMFRLLFSFALAFQKRDTSKEKRKLEEKEPNLFFHYQN